jgi:polyisoprenoid-binding protein YceI
LTYKWLLLAILLATAAGLTQAAKPANAGKLAAVGVPIEVKFGRASSVQFHVSIFGIFKKRGSFTQLRGALSVRAKSARVSARIKTASATMKSPSDAALLKSPAYFDAARFPEIVFQSDSFPIATLQHGGQISGKLTVRGISQQQSFVLTTKPCDRAFAATPWRCAFAVSGTLNRSDFGMKARRGVVSEAVGLTLEIAPFDAKAPPKTQNSGKL